MGSHFKILVDLGLALQLIFALMAGLFESVRQALGEEPGRAKAKGRAGASEGPKCEAATGDTELGRVLRTVTCRPVVQ